MCRGGLGVCSVLVRSVSPCRLVLEVRLFPSPPALFWPFARRLCPLFSSFCLSGLTRLRPGVCVTKTSFSFFFLPSSPLLIIIMQGDRALWCYSVQRSYASEREASIGHGCVPANMSNGLGWFARYRTQFLTDHYNDPSLSSVIPMVTPTRCRRANWGNPV